MAIIITGASECFLNVDISSSGHDLVYVQPDVLFKAGADTQSFEKIFWVYRAPWSTVVDSQPQLSAVPSVENLLLGWLKQNRSLLRNRRRFGDKLVLVNISRNDLLDAFLAANVNIEKEHDFSFLAARLIHGSEVERLLEACIDSILPESCDVYEALEALAWRPGILPNQDMEHELVAASSKDLLRSLLISKTIPLLEKQLSANENRISSAESAARIFSEELEALKKLNCVREKELLLAVTENAAELDALNSKASTNSTELIKAKKEAELQTKALQEREKVLTVEISEARTRNAFLEREVADEKKQNEEFRFTSEISSKEKQVEATQLHEENELLIAQMHELQEELERYYFENKALEMVADETSGSLSRARVVVSTLMKRIESPTDAVLIPGITK